MSTCPFSANFRPLLFSASVVLPLRLKVSGSLPLFVFFSFLFRASSLGDARLPGGKRLVASSLDPGLHECGNQPATTILVHRSFPRHLYWIGSPRLSVCLFSSVVLLPWWNSCCGESPHTNVAGVCVCVCVLYSLQVVMGGKCLRVCVSVHVMMLGRDVLCLLVCRCLCSCPRACALIACQHACVCFYVPVHGLLFLFQCLCPCLLVSPVSPSARTYMVAS